MLSARAPAARGLLSAAIAIVILHQVAGNTELLAFGDSLSDTGNVYKLTLGLIPRSSWYWQGRFSNKPGNWQDHINRLNLSALASSNRAFGGALACTRLSLDADALIPSLGVQVKSYLKGVDSTDARNKTIVAVIWTGHNDLGDLTDLSASERVGLLGDVASCVLSGAEQLLSSGVVDHVVVGTLAPVDLTPDGRDQTLVDADTTVQELLRQSIQTINALLVKGVRSIQGKLSADRSKQKALLWDINARLRDLISNSSRIGFTHNASYACLKYKPGQFVSKGDVPTSRCDDPDSYLFYDDQHPTSRSHLFVAQSLLDTLYAGGLLKSKHQVLARRQLHQQWQRSVEQRTVRRHGLRHHRRALLLDA